MSISIRQFSNRDSASVCEVWEEHHDELGLPCGLTPRQLEMAILAKPYFVADDLRVAVDDSTGAVLGWLLCEPDLKREIEPSNACCNSLVVDTCCVRTRPGDAAVAEALIDDAMRIGRSRGNERCEFKSANSFIPYGMSLSPFDGRAGVLQFETRLIHWLDTAQFAPTLECVLWELDLFGFQAPINRQQLAIRRSHRLEREFEEPDLDWRTSCMLGHVEPVEFRLIDAATNAVRNSLLFWTLSPELQSDTGESIADFQVGSIEHLEDGDSFNRWLFLIGEVCRELQQEQVDSMRVATTAEHQLPNELLRQLGFQATFSGACFSRSL